jgi:hypothetical protein
MRKINALIVLGLFVLALTAGYAQAQDKNARVYVIHGIPGLDLGLDPTLPVDVFVNDALAIPGFLFKQKVGPLAFPAGTYNIKIALAGTTDPVIEADVPFYSNETAVVIAHLTADGGITASKFIYDMSPVSGVKSRFYFNHLAAAPTVDVWATRTTGVLDPMFRVDEISNGDKFFVEVRPKEWRLVLGPTGTGIELTSKHVNLKLANNTIIFALGSLDFSTFTFISLRIKGLK